MHVITGLLIAPLLTTALLQAQAPGAPKRWYRGNTHAHTLNSDGDVPPDAVVRWYREHGYHFTFITDHEFVTDVAPLNALFGAADKFLVIAGQEVTQRVADATHPDGLRQAHVNSLGATRVVWPVGERNIASGMSIAATYARHIPAIRAAGGIAQINHPNFRWSVRLDDLLQLPDSTLFELWNAHILVNNLGGSDSAGRAMLSTEALWDSLLTRGKLLFGVADDDSHSFKPQDAENPDAVRPGRAWVMVRADSLTPDAIVRALARGDFYSSTGVTLRSYHAEAREVRLEIEPAGDRRFLIEFIGSGGRVLAATAGNRASYRLTGAEGYVRVRVTDSSGRRAWTQPVINTMRPR
ncbi:MAG TPA: CehA/McbA family metallohydrolase [Gemmatimonadaceae bacterium]|nr:CehA/McbA family metallohydrolase [Gemmatimonadaceae bacterium]